MPKVKNIVKGFANSALNRERRLHTQRISVCRKCRLYKVDKILGPICNPKLYINPETNEISSIEIVGYAKGCGCNLDAKTRVPEESCPASKW